MNLKSCANPVCNAPFRRMGEGRICVYDISDPKAWGLPNSIRQKVLWLCSKCSNSYYIRLDRQRHTAHVVHKPHRPTKAA